MKILLLIPKSINNMAQTFWMGYFENKFNFIDKFPYQGQSLPIYINIGKNLSFGDIPIPNRKKT